MFLKRKKSQRFGASSFSKFTTHAEKIPLPPLGRSYSEQKNHFAMGRNSERCYYHTDLSRFVLPVSDPSALNFSQFVGFQNFPNLSKIEKVAETCEFTGLNLLNRANFQRFLSGTSVFQNSKFQIREFHAHWVHPKTLFEIAMVLSTNSGSFRSNSHVSATFSILLRFGESWVPTNCEKFNADRSQMGRTNLDKSVW